MAKKTTLTFSLDISADSDILCWLGEQENRSAAIRAALRAYMGRQGVTLGDVYQVVKAIDRKLANGVVVAGGDDAATSGDAPGTEEAAANLDAQIAKWTT